MADITDAQRETITDALTVLGVEKSDDIATDINVGMRALSDLLGNFPGVNVEFSFGEDDGYSAETGQKILSVVQTIKTDLFGYGIVSNLYQDGKTDNVNAMIRAQVSAEDMARLPEAIQDDPSLLIGLLENSTTLVTALNASIGADAPQIDVENVETFDEMPLLAREYFFPTIAEEFGESNPAMWDLANLLTYSYSGYTIEGLGMAPDFEKYPNIVGWNSYGDDHYVNLKEFYDKARAAFTGTKEEFDTELLALVESAASLPFGNWDHHTSFLHGLKEREGSEKIDGMLDLIIAAQNGEEFSRGVYKLREGMQESFGSPKYQDVVTARDARVAPGEAGSTIKIGGQDYTKEQLFHFFKRHHEVQPGNAHIVDRDYPFRGDDGKTYVMAIDENTMTFDVVELDMAEINQKYNAYYNEGLSGPERYDRMREENKAFALIHPRLTDPRRDVSGQFLVRNYENDIRSDLAKLGTDPLPRTAPQNAQTQPQQSAAAIVAPVRGSFNPRAQELVTPADARSIAGLARDVRAVPQILNAGEIEMLGRYANREDLLPINNAKVQTIEGAVPSYATRVEHISMPDPVPQNAMAFYDKDAKTLHVIETPDVLKTPESRSQLQEFLKTTYDNDFKFEKMLLNDESLKRVVEAHKPGLEHEALSDIIERAIQDSEPEPVVDASDGKSPLRRFGENLGDMTIRRGETQVTETSDLTSVPGQTTSSTQ